MFVGKCLEIWSKHTEYHLNIQSSVCICMCAHVRMCISESVLMYVRRLIQKFVDTLNKHSNWMDLWMMLYIHIITSLMNIQIKFYKSILKGNITNWSDIVFLLKFCIPQEELDEKWNKVSRSSYSLPWQRNVNDTPNKIFSTFKIQ